MGGRGGGTGILVKDWIKAERIYANLGKTMTWSSCHRIKDHKKI